MELQNLPWYGQFLIFLVIGAIAFGIFYLTHYKSTQEKIDRLITQIEEVNKEIKRAEKIERNREKIREEIAVKQALLEKLKEILPEKKEISEIIKKTQSIMSSARLLVQNITQRPPRQRDIYVQHPYAMSLEGNYHNLGMFFDQFSRLRKIFIIDGLNISPRGKMTREFTIKANFTASTFTYRETKPAPKKKKGGRRRRR